MALTLRQPKGSKLNIVEMDNNFLYCATQSLSSSYSAYALTSSYATSASYEINYETSSSYADTALLLLPGTQSSSIINSAATASSNVARLVLTEATASEDSPIVALNAATCSYLEPRVFLTEATASDYRYASSSLSASVAGFINDSGSNSIRLANVETSASGFYKRIFSVLSNVSESITTLDTHQSAATANVEYIFRYVSSSGLIGDTYGGHVQPVFTIGGAALSASRWGFVGAASASFPMDVNVIYGTGVYEVKCNAYVNGDTTGSIYLTKIVY